MKYEGQSYEIDGQFGVNLHSSSRCGAKREDQRIIRQSFIGVQLSRSGGRGNGWWLVTALLRKETTALPALIMSICLTQ